MEKLPEAYIKAPTHLLRCAGQLTLMYLFEKAEILAEKFDAKMAKLTDLGDSDGDDVRR